VNGIKTNISSYLLLAIITYFLFSIIYFVKCGLPKLKSKIKNIINFKQTQNNQITSGNIGKKNDINSPPLRNKNIINDNYNRRFERSLKSDKKLKIFSDDILQHKTPEKEKEYKITKKNTINNSINKSKTNFLKKYLNIDYIDYEFNSMPYIKAIQYDKRNCCGYYISLLKKKHPLLFGFCPFEDYNSLIIKSCIFFLSFSIHYMINFLFFTDTMIHKVYEDGGKYTLLYFLPTISICFIISHILTIIIKYIFLSERNINSIKLQVTLKEAYNKSLKVERELKIKYVIFFLFSLILLVGFWIIISSFGAVFQNSQIILIINTLISFSISFIYPFFIIIIPCFFRFCSLSERKNNLACVYNFSQFLELI
jgi:hypothetical protein